MECPLTKALPAASHRLLIVDLRLTKLVVRLPLRFPDAVQRLCLLHPQVFPAGHLRVFLVVSRTRLTFTLEIQLTEEPTDHLRLRDMGPHLLDMRLLVLVVFPKVLQVLHRLRALRLPATTHLVGDWPLREPCFDNLV